MRLLAPFALPARVLFFASADAPQCGGLADGSPLELDPRNARTSDYGPLREDAIAAARAVLTHRAGADPEEL